MFILSDPIYSVSFSWGGANYHWMTLYELVKLEKANAWVDIMLYKDGCKFIHEKVQWIITLAGRHYSKQFSHAVSLKQYFWSQNLNT